MENVYVNPDLTIVERKINYKLRQELQERRKNGERSLVIRKNRIVSVCPRKSTTPIGLDENIFIA